MCPTKIIQISLLLNYAGCILLKNHIECTEYSWCFKIATDQIVVQNQNLNRANLTFIWLMLIDQRYLAHTFFTKLAVSWLSVKYFSKARYSLLIKLLLCFCRALTQPFIYLIISCSQPGSAELLRSCRVNKTCPGSEHSMFPVMRSSFCLLLLKYEVISNYFILPI